MTTEFKQHLRENQDISLGEILPEWSNNTQQRALENSVYEWNRAHRSPMQQQMFNIGENLQGAGIISGGLGIVSAPFSPKYGVLGMGTGAVAAYLGSKIKRSTTPKKYQSYLDDALDDSDTKHRIKVQRMTQSPSFRRDLDTAYLDAIRELKSRHKEYAGYSDQELIDNASGMIDYGELFRKHKIPNERVLTKPIPEELQPLYENHLRTLEEYRRKAHKRYQKGDDK